MCEYVVVLTPGSEDGRIVNKEPMELLRDYVDIIPQRFRGLDVLVYHCGMRAEARGELPNRIIDGRTVYGMIAVTGDGKELPWSIASDLAYDNDWPLVAAGGM